ncbi:MAG TPA: aminotransferase class I/II-fold pyridoxal phosphate-dependent enzyme [Polyangiaceae bacterium]|nr:aminotransferase class I/II-fold pyridoxal phosphate-dependent enzyme [Polyangiaceae bacterium]
MDASSSKPARVANRVASFSYAIRNIVAEAQKVEAEGRPVRYLNIGDPILFGFVTPPHLVEAATRAMRDGLNGYAPSAGIPEAREAVARELSSRGMPVSPDRVLITSGASEGIELALTALLDPGDEVLVPSPTYPLYTAIIAKLGARSVYYKTDPNAGWQPDLDHIERSITPKTRALVIIDPNNPTGAVYSPGVRRKLLEIADRHGLIVLADEVYGDLTYEGPVPPIASLDPDAQILSFSSLSKAYLAPGWRAGWIAASRNTSLDPLLAGIRKLADGRLCSPAPMQHAIAPALTGDKSHQRAFREALAERAAISTRMLNVPGLIECVAPTAAFYAMPRVTLPKGRTDEDFVVELVRRTGILCVHGSGFGLPPEEGFFRVVFLAAPSELAAIYAEIAAFARDFAASGEPR